MPNASVFFRALADDPRRLVLAFVLVAAVVTDLGRGRIPNLLTYPAAAAGLALAAVVGGAGALGGAAAGAAVGFFAFFAIFMFGGVKGGDVKLMAAIGALVGWPQVLGAMFHGVLVGGFLSLAVMIWHGTLLRSVRNVLVTAATTVLPGFERVPLDPANSRGVPYGVALALGTAWSLVEGWSLLGA